MHALEWIAEHGRYRRVIGADLLRRKLARQKGECTWCAGSVPKGSRRWCSRACIDAFNERAVPSYILRRVMERDKGICAICGLDTVWLHSLGIRKSWLGNRALETVCSVGPMYRPNRRGRRNLERNRRLRKYGWSWFAARGFHDHRDLWQADHIVPVSEGGGLCSLDGYRTLCTACHKKESAALAARRRKPRTELLPLFEMADAIGKRGVAVNGRAN
jgi:5-methylcytosine-specific restriction endonuclease McrA